MYVDDLITGFTSEEHGIEICNQISMILKSASFKLRKWASNSQDILKGLQDTSDEFSILELGESDRLKTLGIQWISNTDVLTYNVSTSSNKQPITKRSLLSNIAKIYDLLGLISPCIILVKILIQQLWLLDLDWDDELPRDLLNKWVTFKSKLSVLNKINIPRYIMCDKIVHMELHAFSDANKDAYSAVLYVRTVDENGTVYVRLLCSKTRVSPIKIVLWWLNTEANKLQVFVSNRVSEIQTLSNISNWSYVNTKENPADVASRGMYPDELSNCKVWWNGPSFLYEKPFWPRLFQAGDNKEFPEILREKFWATAGMCLAKKVVRNCIQCFKNKPRQTASIMADLPKHRVQISKPFANTGIDYAGPVLLRDRKGRPYKTYKAYICLFICFATKGVHIELVTELTSEAFLATFRRFAARRGTPNHLYSDNGSNFVGAYKELQKLYKFLENSQSEFVTICSQQKISWHFIPPNTPHFGGLWESNIKNIKHHLHRVIGESILTFEEYSTLLTQIEATLNSRPLYPMSSDPNDLNPITPSHLLIGHALTSPPDPLYEIEQDVEAEDNNFKGIENRDVSANHCSTAAPSTSAVVPNTSNKKRLSKKKIGNQDTNYEIFEDFPTEDIYQRDFKRPKTKKKSTNDRAEGNREKEMYTTDDDVPLDKRATTKRMRQRSSEDEKSELAKMKSLLKEKDAEITALKQKIEELQDTIVASQRTIIGHIDSKFQELSNGKENTKPKKATETAPKESSKED
ncbi:uncharacterized protein [Diabrotica undecimpunctata]|uniref:uncharacterized protein n=1 Tax=Diabrotica undecimpunctata TaxID=50387 RepID=UPI003B63D95A